MEINAQRNYTWHLWWFEWFRFEWPFQMYASVSLAHNYIHKMKLQWTATINNWHFNINGRISPNQIAYNLLHVVCVNNVNRGLFTLNFNFRTSYAKCHRVKFFVCLVLIAWKLFREAYSPSRRNIYTIFCGSPHLSDSKRTHWC